MARTILRAGRIAGGVITAVTLLGIILCSSHVFTLAATSPPATPTPAPTPYTPEQLKLLAVVEEKPGTYDALIALKKLTVQHVEAGQDGLAADALVRLVGPFADSPHVPGAVHEIVRTAVKEEKGAVVSQLCAALTEQAGQPDGAGVWLGMGEILAAVYAADDPGADAAAQRLVTAHGTDGRCVEAFGQIAYAYRQLKKYERSRQYYQYVADNWPYGPRAVYSLRGLVWVNQTLGDEAAANAALDRLLTEYPDDPDLVDCIRPVADSYAGKKDYNTAIRIHQYVSDAQPEHGMAVWSQFNVFKIAMVNLTNYALAQTAYQQIWERFSEHDRIAQVVCEAAWECRKLKRYDEALNMYRAAQAAQPDNDRAIIAQRGIVYCLLGLKDYVGAVAEAQRLFAAFPEDKQLPLTAIEVGDALGRAKLYSEALTMYQYIVNNHPHDSRAIAAQRRVVTAYNSLNDEAAAAQALDVLVTRFADNPQLSKEVYTVGERYRARKDYARARATFDYVAEEFPQTNDALWSRQRCLVMDIETLDDPNNPATEVPAEVLQAADDMILNYAAQPGLVKALSYAGEEYYNRAFRKDRSGRSPESAVEFAKAATIFHKIITEAPVDPKYTGDAYYMTAIGLDHSRRYEEAIEWHKTLIEKCPDHDLAWSSQNWIGILYEKLKVTKRMLADQADAHIEHAYFSLVMNYPSCPLISDAFARLGSLKYSQAAYKEATVHFERYLAHAPERGPAYNLALYKLARSYEMLGSMEHSKELFAKFLTVVAPDKPLYKAAAARLR